MRALKTAWKLDQAAHRERKMEKAAQALENLREGRAPAGNLVVGSPGELQEVRELFKAHQIDKDVLLGRMKRTSKIWITSP